MASAGFKSDPYGWILFTCMLVHRKGETQLKKLIQPIRDLHCLPHQPHSSLLGLVLYLCLQFGGISVCWVLTDVFECSAERFIHLALLLPRWIVYLLSAHPEECSCTTYCLLGALLGWISVPYYCMRTNGAMTSFAQSCNSSHVLVCRDGRWIANISSAFRKVFSLFTKQDWDWMRLNNGLQCASMES